ncbi:enkurin domain-containing protein 1 [Electrophorus electricus]|uniref:enkurin domain-containing protein 1 n=1 Tax=Electrophorus electricus TaxID=8005 RepID=UPI000F0A7359|nr:enkurin domain-containing protein 1 [Electrophorus electricus]XP_026877972.1 enkurin domain-containing protein 1 [Electrophorus electricus]
MCEGPSVLSGPIPPDPSLFPEYYKRPVSARGRLEGNSWGESLALLNGPLAPDPALYPGCYSARVPHLPRVGPNATHILERNQKGEVGALLKLEGISLTPSTPKHTPAKRDYGKENVRRLREIQRRFREQEAQKEHAKPVPVKALWTSPKYQDISSRVMAQLQEKSPPKRPECQNFLRAHSLCGTGSRPQPCWARSTPALSSAASPKPDATDSEFQVKGHMVDFVRHNARAAGKTVIRRSQSMQNLRDKQPPSSVKGRVPQYLEERKEQWRREEEEKKKNMPDPSVPAGHSQMLDRERQETLKTLKETHKSLVSELLSLPVRADTLSVRSRRAVLDQRLSEIEEAIKIFSRDKVYIKNDS